MRPFTIFHALWREQWWTYIFQRVRCFYCVVLYMVLVSPHISLIYGIAITTIYGIGVSSELKSPFCQKSLFQNFLFFGEWRFWFPLDQVYIFRNITQHPRIELFDGFQNVWHGQQWVSTHAKFTQEMRFIFGTICPFRVLLRWYLSIYNSEKCWILK